MTDERGPDYRKIRDLRQAIYRELLQTLPEALWTPAMLDVDLMDPLFYRVPNDAHTNRLLDSVVFEEILLILKITERQLVAQNDVRDYLTGLIATRWQVLSVHFPVHLEAGLEIPATPPLFVVLGRALRKINRLLDEYYAS